jgi:RNA polymerase sigma factor (sigma-70 family)
MLFPTTHWSLLAKASVNGDSESSKALEELCRRYRQPAYLFIVSRGVSGAEAEDLTQEFLVHLIEKSTFRRADRMRGRFRSFLLGALVRFLSDKSDARTALKRGGSVDHISFDAGQEFEESVELRDEAMKFDREWALTILERALERVREEYQEKPEVLAILKRFLPGSAEQPTYDEAARGMGISVGALKSEIHRLRQRFRGLMREEVAQTVSAPHEIEEEMAHLQRVLMDRSNDFNGSRET